MNEGNDYNFDFDLDRMKTMVECDFISLPEGISKAEDIDAWLMDI